MDLVLTDLMHPGGTGIELLEQMRAERGLRHIPVIVLSGIAKHHELESWRSGARAVLQKPFSPTKLIETANRVLEERKDPDAALIELGTESQAIDYKEDLDLSSKMGRAGFAKDVIAMANYGGGTIIVGVAERAPGAFSPQGLDEKRLKELETTKLVKAIRSYIDPPVPLTSRRVLIQGRVFVFVEVPEANDQLIMAARMNDEVKLYLGRIYGRTAAAESAELQDPAEVRKIINRLVTTKFQIWRARTGID